MRRESRSTLITLVVLIATFACGTAFAFTGNDYLAKDKKGRVLAVTSLIDGARQSGVIIKQSPKLYCIKLDQFYAKHPELKRQQLSAILKTLIVMEYDWTQKGVNKDELARQYLDEKTYKENKARFE